jgi:pilus assembly protein CpaE
MNSLNCSRPSCGKGTPALRSPLQVGRIIVFYGTKGGVGTSLLATNVAVALARYLPPDSVCLLDLDLQFGAIPMLLNLQPKTNLATLAQRFQGELDFEMLRSFLLLHSESNLRVLAAPSRPELAELVTTYLIERVLQVLKNHFAFILVDTPNMLQDTTLAALDAADHILVVTALDLLAIRNAEIVLTMFQKLYPAERIRLVLNRSNTRFGGLTPEQVEEHLRMTIAARIPSDGQLAVTSINEGVPFRPSSPRCPHLPSHLPTGFPHRRTTHRSKRNSGSDRRQPLPPPRRLLARRRVTVVGAATSRDENSRNKSGQSE